MLFTMALAATNPIIHYACEYFDLVKVEKTAIFYSFQVAQFFLYTLLNFQVLVFLYIAQFDARKRLNIIEILTESLELDFNQKNANSIRFPTLDFLCPCTILSWLEARKLSLTIGSKYQARIEIFLTYTLACCGLFLAFWFVVFSNFFGLTIEIMNTEQWINLFVKTVVLVYFCLAVLLPTSLINK